jgi:ATP-dependent HslUV protease ATP-binding subunit HslU
MQVLTPREIVSELDKFIVGQDAAKRMVAIAMRNRWRRMQVAPELRDEIAPKNIIMIGPTGVGKTEIARRLAKLAGAPFVKVEASKFTEVGYVGRDVESMIRDLMDIGVNLVRQEEAARVKVPAERQAEERLLDLLLPPAPARPAGFLPGGPAPAAQGPADGDPRSTRDKLRRLWREGALDDRLVEMEVAAAGPQVQLMSMPGMEDMEFQLRDMMGRMFPPRRKTRKLTVREAHAILVQEESDKLVDMDAVLESARERVEQAGIVFVDEIDKVCARKEAHGPDVSREGVQRDLLPIVEGSVVNTKHGMVRTDHILFIAAGAFHVAKPSDLMPELQGRFPLRVELSALTKADFLRILTEPQNALTVQYSALLATEGAGFAQEVNSRTENIGARRLYTIMEKVLQDLSFEAPDRAGSAVTVDRSYVREKLADVQKDRDLSRYIL